MGVYYRVSSGLNICRDAVAGANFSYFAEVLQGLGRAEKRFYTGAGACGIG